VCLCWASIFLTTKLLLLLLLNYLEKLYSTHPKSKLQLPATNMPDIKRNFAPTRGSCKSQNRTLKLNLHLQFNITINGSVINVELFLVPLTIFPNKGDETNITSA
jgi:hypothetical protein